MAVTAEQLEEIRDHIGTAEPPTDADLAASYERLGSVTAVAHSVLRRRLEEMRARPAVLKVDGDHSEDWTKNLDQLAKQVAALADDVAVEAGTGGTVQVARLRRGGARR